MAGEKPLNLIRSSVSSSSNFLRLSQHPYSTKKSITEFEAVVENFPNITRNPRPTPAPFAASSSLSLSQGRHGTGCNPEGSRLSPSASKQGSDWSSENALTSHFNSHPSSMVQDENPAKSTDLSGPVSRSGGHRSSNSSRNTQRVLLRHQLSSGSASRSFSSGPRSLRSPVLQICTSTLTLVKEREVFRSAALSDVVKELSEPSEEEMEAARAPEEYAARRRKTIRHHSSGCSFGNAVDASETECRGGLHWRRLTPDASELSNVAELFPPHHSAFKGSKTEQSVAVVLQSHSQVLVGGYVANEASRVSTPLHRIAV